MVAAVSIDAPQGRILVGARAAAHTVVVPQMRGLTAINYPSQGLNATQGRVVTTFRQTAVIDAAQARILVAVRGRIANPTIRAWTFTLDGHDFYVLRLGDNETLVYDASTEQWVEWTSKGLPAWRVNTGISWIGGQALADQYGSSVVVGDDVWGVLGFLDPECPYDEHPDYLNPVQQLEFERIVMGQVAERGRGVTPCYAVFLTGDNYGISVDDFVPSVTLEYSDDAGKTFDNAGTINVTVDTTDQTYEWLSLGQIDNPGRLFRITDNGVFTRIDDAKMNDD
jgi:hypothetical protein